jgi:Flp pilus assembly pilin Flp
MTNFIARFVRDEQGQDIIEYALLGSFVAFGALVGAQNLAIGYTDWFNGIRDKVVASVPK